MNIKRFNFQVKIHAPVELLRRASEWPIPVIGHWSFSKKITTFMVADLLSNGKIEHFGIEFFRTKIYEPGENLFTMAGHLPDENPNKRIFISDIVRLLISNDCVFYTDVAKKYGITW